jgi:transcription initiation factor TFIID subunit 5
MLWDLGSGKKIAKFHGHRDAVNSVSFSGEGSLVASGSQDHTVRLWDTHIGAPADQSAMDTAPDGPGDEDAVEAIESSPELAVFQTKATPVYTTKFSRKNLLLTAGVFAQPRSE